MSPVVLREHAVAAILAEFKVDLSDFMHASNPDTAQRFGAIVAVELQKGIMEARRDGDHAAERLRDLSGSWGNAASPILSYATEITCLVDRIFQLTTLRDLAVHPFLPKADRS